MSTGRSCSGWFRSGLYVAATSATGTALLILLVVFVYDLRLTGSAADWLLALFNGVMASAAVAAFLVARSWLPQLTTQEGYKTAIALVNDQYIMLGSEHPPAVAADKAVEAFRKQNESNLGSRIEEYEEAIRYLKITLDAAQYITPGIKNARFCLSTYGLTEAPRYKTVLETMESAFEASLPLGEELLQKLNSDIKRRHEAIKKPQLFNEKNAGEAIWRSNLEQNGQELLTHYDTYKKAISRFQTAHFDVFNNRPAIGTLFVPVRRNWFS